MARLLIILLGLGLATTAAAQSCGGSGVALQVLGSGGPALAPNRAGRSALIWMNGQARVLVDAGGGTGLRFAESGARMADVDVVLFTSLHATHTADLPTLVESARHEPRTRPLPIFGPPGNRQTPSTITFVRDLFDGRRGTFRHLGELISPIDKSSYKLEPHDVREPAAKLGAPRAAPVTPPLIFQNDRLRIQALSWTKGILPTTAYRIESGGKVVVFLASIGITPTELAPLLDKTDVLVTSMSADGQSASPAFAESIGKLARDGGVRNLVLLPRPAFSGSHEEEMLASLRKHYTGMIQPADDLMCVRP